MEAFGASSLYEESVSKGGNWGVWLLREASHLPEVQVATGVRQSAPATWRLTGAPSTYPSLSIEIASSSPVLTGGVFLLMYVVTSPKYDSAERHSIASS